MRIESERATEVATGVLRAVGVPVASAELQTLLLMEAELRGVASHGLLRLPRIVERIHNGVLDPMATGVHDWTAEALLHVNGQNGLGPVVAMSALAAVSDRARKTGVACVSISSSNHVGMLGWYAEQIAQGGQICLGLTTSEALVHPWGGRRAMVGTNPIAIGVPAAPRPFVLDMATSEISMGKVHDYAHRGVPLETGWALDGQGFPTTDAVAARDGALAPFGGAKGYGLGLAFEVMVAALTGSALGTDVLGTLDSINPCTKGDVFIVAEPMAGPAPVSAYLSAVRSSPPADPDTPVSVPGDGSARRRAAAQPAGIEVADSLWASISALPGADLVSANTRTTGDVE